VFGRDDIVAQKPFAAQPVPGVTADRRWMGDTMFKDFKSFLHKSNALALALGVIIGAATGKVVTSIVEDLLMPVIGLILPAGDWREAKVIIKSATDAAGKVTHNAIAYGHFVGTVVDFFIIATIVYMLTKWLLRPEPAPPSKTCPQCLETVPVAALRCKSCASALA
jgi:large conductance mechanosensitive channel